MPGMVRGYVLCRLQLCGCCGTVPGILRDCDVRSPTIPSGWRWLTLLLTLLTAFVHSTGQLRHSQRLAFTTPPAPGPIANSPHRPHISPTYPTYGLPCPTPTRTRARRPRLLDCGAQPPRVVAFAFHRCFNAAQHRACLCRPIAYGFLLRRLTNYTHRHLPQHCMDVVDGLTTGRACKLPR